MDEFVSQFAGDTALLGQSQLAGCTS